MTALQEKKYNDALFVLKTKLLIDEQDQTSRLEALTEADCRALLRYVCQRDRLATAPVTNTTESF